ncbi:MAG: type III pantothenate kinase [Verrucomicrobia bacterium]|nr:type III pantothenate kinase [Verrucomicrobiota bacterium]MCH8513610.1 type III pantothenate kinase [Kiritimatiellia bacterium]
MSAPVLVIDIGNTSTTTALVDADGVRDVRRYLRRDGVEANVPKAFDAYRGQTPRGIALGSVVPEITPPWRDELSRQLGVDAWELVPGNPLEIAVTYPQPRSIGADRLANAVAAVHAVGAPVVVADFGTALTFDIVLEGEGYVGGVIAPGIDMMYSYFGEKTALLPKLTPAPADKIIGKSTAEAMHAGAHYGYRGMVREIFHEIKKSTGLKSIKLLATGGFAKQVLHDFDESVIILPNLTLEGLARARAYALHEPF